MTKVLAPLALSLAFLALGQETPKAPSPSPAPQKKVSELVLIKIQKAQAEKREADLQIQNLNLQLALMQRAARDLQATSAEKDKEAQALRAQAFKAAELSPSQWTLDEASGKFSPIPVPAKPAPASK